MDKEFVTYKTALALKEIGFDEPCISDDFYADGKIIINDDFITNTEHDKLTQECNDDNIENGDSLIEKGATIPLKSQVFRWFREKHGMLGYIELVEPEYGGNYGYKLYYKLNYLSIDHWSKGYKTYEEAENDLINKLIEIIKNK